MSVEGFEEEPVRLQALRDMKAIREHISSEVRAEMARHRVGDSEIAAHLGQNQQWFSRRKLGYVPFDAAELMLVAQYLRIPVTRLMGISEARSEAPEAAAWQNAQGPHSGGSEGPGNVRPKGFEPLTF